MTAPMDLSHNHSPMSLLGNVQITRVPLKGNMEGEPSLVEDEDVMDSSIDTVFQAMGNLWSRQTMASPEPSTSAASEDHDMVVLEEAAATTDTNNIRRNRHVRFDSTVTVLSIPNRYSYSDRMRRYLWNAPDHMKREVIRNTVEYTADGWDWQAALEEKDHFFNPTTQEYIHPVHLDIAHMPLEDQEAILPPNYINPALLNQQQQGPPTLVRQKHVVHSSVPTFTAATTE